MLNKYPFIKIIVIDRSFFHMKGESCVTLHVYYSIMKSSNDKKILNNLSGRITQNIITFYCIFFIIN